MDWIIDFLFIDSIGLALTTMIWFTKTEKDIEYVWKKIVILYSSKYYNLEMNNPVF